MDIKSNTWIQNPEMKNGWTFCHREIDSFVTLTLISPIGIDTIGVIATAISSIVAFINVFT